jgi:hypothetical protein
MKTKVDAKKEDTRFEKQEDMVGASLPGIITTTSAGNLGGKEEEDKKSKESESSK